MLEFFGDTRLLITTVGYVISFILVFFLFLLVLFKSERKTVHWAFLGFNFSVMVYAVMFVFGTNITDPALDAKIWLLSAFDIMIAVCFLHWVLAITERLTRVRTRIVWGLYAVGAVLFTAMFLYPDLVIPSVEPKMYFKNYPNPGILYTVMAGFFASVIVYTFVELGRAYHLAKGAMRNRLLYVFIGSLVGFGTGSSSFILTWDIPFDPVFSMFFGLYNAVFVYAILKHHLMDIKLAVKLAFVYSVLIAAISWVIIIIGTLNDTLFANATGFSAWIVPVIAAFVAVVIGKLYLNKAEEAEKIEHEFITVAAHKLRAPLTRSRYASQEILENIQEKGDSAYVMTDTDRELLKRVIDDNDVAIHLADTLLKAAEIGRQDYASYVYTPADLRQVVSDVLAMQERVFEEKSITLKKKFPSELPLASLDVSRMSSVIAILVENAALYAKEGTTVTVSLEVVGNKIRFSIQDEGIGIAKEDIKNIFLKLYRTKSARSIHTEGIGVGLFTAKNILEQHGGKIWAESAGEGKGSTFYFDVPTL